MNLDEPDVAGHPTRHALTELIAVQCEDRFSRSALEIRSRLSRFRSRLQKRDFFKGEGVCFHDLYQEIFRGARKDPQYSRVVSLMTHLALADNAHTSPIPEM